MTRGDGGIIAAVAFLVLAAVLVAASPAGDDGLVTISGPCGQTRVDPCVDATYVIEGRNGEVVFETGDGAVRCVSSDCSDQVCVRAGEVRPGKPVVCAPEGVIAAVAGGGGLDAVSR